jgi:hypothetical protein
MTDMDRILAHACVQGLRTLYVTREPGNRDAVNRIVGA